MNTAAIIILLLIGPPMFMLCKAKTGSYLNFGSVFTIMWTAVGVMANTGVYGIYLPSTIVNISIIAGVFVFGITYALKARNEIASADDILSMNCEVRTKMVIVCNIIALIFMLPHFAVSLALIQSRGFAYVRAVNYTGFDVTGRSTLINLVLQDICFPMFFATSILSVIMLLLGKRSGVKILLLSLVNVTVYEIINGARNGFVVLILVVVFAFFKIRFPLMRERVQNISRSKKRIIYPIVFLLIWMVVYITGERSLGNKSLLENFYYYFFAGPSYLSQLLQQLQGYKLNNDLFLGSATFGFIYNIFATLMNTFFGFNIFNSGYTMNSVLSNAYLSVSSSARINAMATVFFPFLMDYGYLGIIIGPMIIAMISQYIAKKQQRRNSIRWYAIGIYWLYVIYRTIFKWELIAMSAFFVLFFIVLFTKNEIVRD